MEVWGRYLGHPNEVFLHLNKFKGEGLTFFRNRKEVRKEKCGSTRK
jgi:hypothetical protein